MKKEEYVVDLNEQDLALGEEGYIETEHRKIGRSNTDNTLSNQAIIFPTFGSTRRKKPNPEEKESQGQILDARRRHAEHTIEK